MSLSFLYNNIFNRDYKTERDITAMSPDRPNSETSLVFVCLLRLLVYHNSQEWHE